MKRIMIAGTHSGCGKTTVTCAILAALKKRGHNLSAFKCGPDYIDPMFHKTVLDIPSYNLDTVLMTDDTVNYLLQKHSSDVNIIEGVMGFYDGLSFSTAASTYELSEKTDTNVILVADCKGKSLSAMAEIKGFKDFKTNRILGVIFNNLPQRLYNDMARECRSIGLQPLGFMPGIMKAKIESRHLGLYTAQEIGDIKDKMNILALECEKSIDIDKILEMAECGDKKNDFPPVKKIADVKIAVARDMAFCFYYEDNLNLLCELGADITYFSPLENEPVPDCDGIIIGGGYPELYANALEKNTVTINTLTEKIEDGIPCIAECGGFMYLQETLETDGRRYKMAGIIKGNCKNTNRLQRFGYMEMTAQTNNILCVRGHKIRAREFHYFDSDNCGKSFIAEKNGKRWSCVNTDNNLFAGFGHIHFYSDITLAKNFIENCEKYKCAKQRN